MLVILVRTPLGPRAFLKVSFPGVKLGVGSALILNDLESR